MIRVVLVVVVGLLVVRPGLAQSPEPSEAPPSEEAVDPNIEEAKTLFRKGVALYEADDLERALDYFLRSKDRFASIQNMSNAAICLDKLGRYDEALMMYEQVLVDFEGDLSQSDREAIGPAMKRLRERVGSVFVAANTAGRVLIDGKVRGTLPLNVPIRVMPGERTIRVLQSGFEPFEVVRAVTVGKTVNVEAKLKPLRQAGLLRLAVAELGDAAAKVFVDGAPVGEVRGGQTWEGTLGPGDHVVWALADARGTAPRRVVVVEGQTAEIRLEAGVLGAPVRVTTQPESAALTLDGAALGAGGWSGRLPVGDYRFRGREEGYVTGELQLTVTEDGAAQQRALSLEIDPDHPRWPRPASGDVVIELFGGGALSPTLASEAESVGCVDCPGLPGAFGGLGGALVGYRFDFGLGLELAGGFVRLDSRFDRVVALPDADLALNDDLALQGPWATLGLSYRYPVNERFGLGVRGAGGALFASASDNIDGRAMSSGGYTNVVAEDEDPISTGIAAIVTAEVFADVAIAESWRLGLGLGAMVLLSKGPRLDGRRLAVELNCTNGGAGCLATGQPLPDERASGLTVIGTPQLRLGYDF